ncbi:MAG TPA: NAD(P)-dependent oxidoreductase [Candidatus Acidoferrum sp.]|jgi:uroporphyrin-III C-methyltransferase/precorrin-2 dehydrogenase/sirohydrochlorin ferrochelatase/precorrin-2 dehydrogenase/sirohydrochlorin ferrochelatase|nr:NAD(P)-dependent oxidoreductase [Candidatus Acidoferrum sp.]
MTTGETSPHDRSELGNRLVDDPLPPHGFYPVSLNVVGRRCVVIGPRDDREAVEKVAALREVDADVVWIEDPAKLRDEDVVDAFFVISTPQDAALSARLRALADRHRFLLCCIDQPRFGFVAMQAIAKVGPVQIGISTGGVAPRVGKALKEALQGVLDGKFGRFIECLATQKLRNRARLADDQTARRSAMIEAAEGFEVEMRTSYPAWFEDEFAALGPRREDQSRA